MEFKSTPSSVFTLDEFLDLDDKNQEVSDQLCVKSIQYIKQLSEKFDSSDRSISILKNQDAQRLLNALSFLKVSCSSDINKDNIKNGILDLCKNGLLFGFMEKIYKEKQVLLTQRFSVRPNYQSSSSSSSSSEDDLQSKSLSEFSETNFRK